MHIPDLAKSYQSKTDEELLQLAASSEQLTPEAHSALTGELARRGIDRTKSLDAPAGEVDEVGARGLTPLPDLGVSEFVEEVFHVYRGQFWLFIKLVAPAVVLGYFAVSLGANEAREIARRLLRIPISEIEMRRTEFVEIWLARSVGYLVSWMAFSFSFGAICFAVEEIKAGIMPSVPSSLGATSHRPGPFLRLSLLLLSMILAAEVAGGVLVNGILWILRYGQIQVGQLAIWALTFTLVCLVLLVMSRFGLAIPALLLDDYPVGQALFRSDKLTEGKWLILAALLTKSLVGGYIAGVLPFWMASFIPADTRLPQWFPWALTTASLAGVTLAEPTMFIGFALLYLKTTAPPSRA